VDVVDLFTYAFAVASISLTVTRSKIFERPRVRIQEKFKWVGELISCPYCFSHWVSLILVIMYRPSFLPHVWMPLDITITAFIIVGMGAIIIGVVSRILFRDPTQEEIITKMRSAIKILKSKTKTHNHINVGEQK